MTFDKYAVVAAPFPYTDRPVTKRRPCVVVGQPDNTKMCWVLMITSAKNKAWSGDVLIDNIEGTGLSVNSFVRTSKIATVENDVLEVIGKLDSAVSALVSKELESHLRVVIYT